MAISKETERFARTLVSTESHGREALLALSGSFADPDLEKEAERQISKMLKGALQLTDCLLTWTASDTIQKGKYTSATSHLGMMCHLGAINVGVEYLLKARQGGDLCHLISCVRQAMEAICGMHADLLKWCLCNKIDVPDFPTTRCGGR